MDRKQISTTDGPMIVDSTSSNPLSAGQNQLQTPVGPAQHTVKPCEDSYYEVKRTIDHLLHRSTATAERQPATLKTAPLANSDLDIIRIIESSTRIHYSLYKFQSDLSPVYSRMSGIKRRFADSLVKDSLKDKRFVKRAPLSKFRDLKPALVVHLYPSYFKLDNDDVYAYEGPMGFFIQTLIGRQVLLPLVAKILEQHGKCNFYDGGLLVEVIDHRTPFNTSSGNLVKPPINTTTAFLGGNPIQHEAHRFLARPSTDAMPLDLEQLQEEHELTDEEMLEVESKILLSTERNICLHPSPDVARINSILEFNKRKFAARSGDKKRRRLDDGGGSASSISAAAATQDNRDNFERVLSLRWPETNRRSNSSSNLKQLYNMGGVGVQDGSSEGKTDFKQVAFIQDWRRTQLVTDGVASVCLEKKGSNVLPAPAAPPGAPFGARRISRSAPNQLVRTMKFVKKSHSKPDEPIFTTLNIYAFIDGTFEAVLRWGNRPETSIGNALVSDTRVPPEFTAAQRAQQRAVGTSRQSNNSVAAATTTTIPTPGSTMSPSPANMTIQQPPPVAMHRTASPVVAPGTQPARRSNTIAAPTAQYGNSATGLQQPQPPRPRSVTQLSRADGSLSSGSSGGGGASPSISPNFPPSPQITNGGIALSAAPVAAPNPSNVGAAASNQQQQQKRAVSTNAAFLQRLLRLPFNQVPEQHKALYIQVKQRLAQQQQMKLQQQQQQQQHQQFQAGISLQQQGPNMAGFNGQNMMQQQQQQQINQSLQQQQFLMNTGNMIIPQQQQPLAGTAASGAQFGSQLTLQQQQALIRQLHQQQQHQQQQQHPK